MPPEDWKSICLTVDGQSTEGDVDKLGRFSFQGNGKPNDSVRLTIYAGSKLVYNDFQILPGPRNSEAALSTGGHAWMGPSRLRNRNPSEETRHAVL